MFTSVFRFFGCGTFSSDVSEESDAEYLPTPIRREKERVEQQKFEEKVRPPIEVKVSPITLPNQVGFVVHV